jgi:predicted nucleotidyltransferase
MSEADLAGSLNTLLCNKKIFLLDEFYSLQNDRSLAERRKIGNKRATELLAKAEKISKRLYKFPYVRGVAISGSVSKNFADEQADIDYFIITKANRLWIARTFLHLYKKNPFLKKRNEYYCMNYFLDEADLVIEEKNIYTATELYTIIPMACNGSMKNLFEANSWSHRYFPNLSFPPVKEQKNFPWYKRSTEAVFNNKLGDWLEDYFFGLTTKRWKRKEDEKRLNTKGELMGLKTGKHFSKPNPIFFHDWFMDKYEQRLNELIKN